MVTGAMGASVGALPGAPKEWDITVIGDMTEAGRKIAPPTRESPAVYVPLVLGYREGGQALAGEAPPPARDAVLRELAKTLAENHYLVASERRLEPSLLLVLAWGSVNPVVDFTEVEVPGLPSADGPTIDVLAVKSIVNAKEMLALVAGRTPQNFALTPKHVRNSDWEEVSSDMKDERYFVLVAAFDWKAAEAKKKVLLWAAKMSVRSTGTTLAQVFPSLIKNGAPIFGRETAKPMRITAPVPVREGRVDVGPTQVVPDAKTESPRK